MAYSTASAQTGKNIKLDDTPILVCGAGGGRMTTWSTASQERAGHIHQITAALLRAMEQDKMQLPLRRVFRVFTGIQYAKCFAAKSIRLPAYYQHLEPRISAEERQRHLCTSSTDTGGVANYKRKPPTQKRLSPSLQRAKSSTLVLATPAKKRKRGEPHLPVPVIAIASDGQDGKTYHIKASRIIQGTSQLLTLQSLGEEDEEESPDEMEMSESQRTISNLARILADETPITERVLAVPPCTRQVWVTRHRLPIH